MENEGIVTSSDVQAKTSPARPHARKETSEKVSPTIQYVENLETVFRNGKGSGIQNQLDSVAMINESTEDVLQKRIERLCKEYSPVVSVLFPRPAVPQTNIRITFDRETPMPINKLTDMLRSIGVDENSRKYSTDGSKVSSVVFRFSGRLHKNVK